jgi:hypothetical protein
MLKPTTRPHVGTWTITISVKGATPQRDDYTFKVKVRNSKFCDKLLTAACPPLSTVIYKLNSGVMAINLPACELVPDVCEIEVKTISTTFVPNPDSPDD